MRLGFIAFLLSFPLALTASAQTAQLVHNGGGGSNPCPESSSSSCTPLPINGPITTQPSSPDGNSYGGQQPIVGAQVYLFQPGVGLPGTASVSIMSNTPETQPDNSGGPTNGDYYVTTDSNGFFYLTGNYSCTAGVPVYLYAMGGDPSNGIINPEIGEMAVLGICPASGTFYGTLSYIWVDEITTVATAYSLAGFATDALHISYSGSSLAFTGITNAFNNFFNLVDLTTGAALTTSPNGAQVPQALLNSLGDIIASCINSGGAGSPECSNLLPTATSNGIPIGTTGAGTEPTDTATAAIYIAKNPASNVTTLFNLIPPGAPFVGLGTAPNDFTVALDWSKAGGGCSCTNGGPAEPTGIAVDGQGNVWVADYYNGNANVFVTELSASTGTFSSLAYAPNGVNPNGISIDSSGNAWVTGSSGFPFAPTSSSVVEVSNNAGTLSASATLTNGGLYGPEGLAFDSLGDVWVSNTNGSSVSEFSPLSGYTPIFPSGDVNSVLSYAYGIAGDSASYVWVSTPMNVVKLNQAGAVLFNVPVSSAGGLSIGAVDNSNNLWVANFTGNSVSEVSSSGSVLATYSSGGFNTPTSVAIDGQGNLWIANPAKNGTGNSSITELSSAGTPLSGANGFLPAPNADFEQIAIDGSGNAWVTSQVDLFEIIGVATPVVTPLAYGAAHSGLGARP